MKPIFEIDDQRYVYCNNVPQLQGLKGLDMGEGIVGFFGKGYDMFLANTRTGKIRQFANPQGDVLVDMKDIDMKAIEAQCENGLINAVNRRLEYAKLNCYCSFENGRCPLMWTLYPDGRYFADEDGYGAESNREESVYALINTDLEIIAPFRPVKQVREYMENYPNYDPNPKRPL